MRDAIQHNLKAMLEESHLYRNRSIDLGPILKLADAKYTATSLEDEFSHRPWSPYSRNRGFTSTEESILKHAAAGTDALGTPARQMRLTFILPTVRTWCAACKSHELHDSIPHVECSPYHLNHHEVRDVLGIQKFLFNYRCHRCKGELLVFMVRRDKLKLQLCGRSRPYFPEIPVEIPKALHAIYAHALAAAACNDLPAAFYHMRTLLEHHMKAVCGLQMQEQLVGSELCERYNSRLDPMVAERAALTREFERCSVYLHNRSGELSDFEEIRQRVFAHFRLIKTLESIGR